tara:strand:- start:458 stop:661 length:204 start_codon:yes stop_codon:yes gene_type:complete
MSKNLLFPKIEIRFLLSKKKVIKKDMMHRKNTISIGGIWGSIFTPILTTIKKIVAKNIKYIPLLNLI